MLFPLRIRFASVGTGLLFLACSGRDRLTFPTSDDGLGPDVTITDPSQDTTVSAGPAALIAGRVVDSDGIDTVYFDVQGGLSSFPPLLANGADTVTFSLPVTTNGLAGSTITIAISAVNLAAIHGDTVSRQVTVQ
ncbi:MAG: Ig-like domain-containing protein [Gemmatimonadota bacterium]